LHTNPNHLDLLNKQSKMNNQASVSKKTPPSSQQGPNDTMKDHDFFAPPQEFPHFNTSREQSNKFYNHDQQPGGGARYVASKSITTIEGINSNISDDDITLRLLLADLCMELSRPQRNKLAKILELAVKCTERNCSSAPGRAGNSSYAVPIPDTAAKLRAAFMDGANSVSELLPHPAVQTIRDENEENTDHGYISLRDIVTDLLARKAFPKNSSTSSRLDNTGGLNGRVLGTHESKRYQEIVQEARIAHASPQEQDDLVVLTINEWSDDFEANTVKQNRGGIWLKTITISLTTSTTTHEHTYLVALGRKDSCHDVVETRFAAELRSLRDPLETNLFFHGGLGRSVPVHMALFVATKDQPERRSSLYLMGGNSVSHARFAWACDHLALASKLPSCANCLASLISIVNGTQAHMPGCCNCLNWSLEGENDLLYFPAPLDYPQDQFEDNELRQLRPVKLSYELLIEKVNLARTKLETDQWSRKSTESFLKFYCLNDEIITRLLSGADYRAKAKQSEDDADGPIHVMENSYSHLMDDESLPPIWTRGDSLQCHIDVVMHLLFLGITKTTVLLVRDWVKANASFPTFQKYAKPIFRKVPKVGWCTTAPYTGDKLGGWVSENYLAFARLSCWFYGPLESIVSKQANQPNILPIGPHGAWGKDQLCTWLVSRGVTLEILVDPAYEAPREVKEKAQLCINEGRSMTTALKSQLLVFVRFLDVDDPVNRRPPELEFHKFDHVHDMMRALHVMTARIMAPVYTEESIQEMEYFIKIFLSRFAHVSDNLYPNASKPKWLSSYNFMCLLNLPSTCKDIGPLRNVWEGSTKGEGFIRFVKPEITMGLRENWEVNTLKKVIKKISIRQLIQNLNATLYGGTMDDLDDAGQNGQKDHDTSTRPSTDYIAYKDLNSISQLFRKREPVSAVILGKHEAGDPDTWSEKVPAGVLTVVIKGGLQLQIYQTESADMTDETHAPRDICVVNGLSYCQWRLDDRVSPFCTSMATGARIITSVLLLPLLGREGYPKENATPTYYTVIDSIWRTMDENCRYLEQPNLKPTTR
jgi:hypothetical protein